MGNSMSNTTVGVYTIFTFSPNCIPSRILPLVEAISACEKAEKWQHALALLADLASRPSMGSMQPWKIGKIE